MLGRTGHHRFEWIWNGQVGSRMMIVVTTTRGWTTVYKSKWREGAEIQFSPHEVAVVVRIKAHNGALSKTAYQIQAIRQAGHLPSPSSQKTVPPDKPSKSSRLRTRSWTLDSVGRNSTKTQWADSCILSSAFWVDVDNSVVLSAMATTMTDYQKKI